jgi:hypothetical protein
MLALLTLLSGTAHAQEIKNITTEVVDVKDVDVDLTGAHFTVVLEMTRHRGPPTKVRGLEYQIIVANEVVGSAVWDEKTRLKKGEPVHLDVPVDIGVNAGPALLRSVGAGDASVTIDGTAKVRVLGIPRSRPFTTTYSL